jgi:hypothetical protein
LKFSSVEAKVLLIAAHFLLLWLSTMPPKRGENPKAAEARDRKETKKTSDTKAKMQAEEDAEWEDDDRCAL